MIDNKLNQVRTRLINSGVSQSVADSIIESIVSSVQDVVVNSLESGLSSAQQSAEQMRAKGFLSEIQIRPTHAGLEITTSSGNHDFSKPDFPMLDRLLAKGRVSKDGSIYKTIPIGGSKSTKTETVRDLGTVSASISADKQRPRSLTEMVTNIANSFGMGSRSVIKQDSGSQISQVQFRTASSKQDRNKDWVIPGFQADMGPVLNEINAIMAMDLEKALESAIRDHEWEIENAIRNA